MFTPELSKDLKKLFDKGKDKELISATAKKIKSICQESVDSINHYKNLRHDLSNFKRVHILKSFVLLFEVDFDKKIIYFAKLEHHDIAYK